MLCWLVVGGIWEFFEERRVSCNDFPLRSCCKHGSFICLDGMWLRFVWSCKLVSLLTFYEHLVSDLEISFLRFVSAISILFRVSFRRFVVYFSLS